MTEYTKGDYTRCYEDICEIWHEDNLYCIVRTDDADKIVEVLNENEQLKSDINLLTDQYNNIFEKNEQLKQQLEDNLQFLIRASERLGFESLDHLLYTLDKGEITGYSTANWEKSGDVE